MAGKILQIIQNYENIGMPEAQYSLSIPWSAIVWTSAQYINADVSRFAIATQKGKAGDKSLSGH